jgi:hypothetical protein
VPPGPFTACPVRNPGRGTSATRGATEPGILARCGARTVLARAGYPQVHVAQADAEYGYPDTGPYGAIIVTVESMTSRQPVQFHLANLNGFELGFAKPPNALSCRLPGYL